DQVLPRAVLHRPEAAAHDKVDVALVLRLPDDPGPRRRLEPHALAIENPARFGIERLETRMRRKRIRDHHRAPPMTRPTVAELAGEVKRFAAGIPSLANATRQLQAGDRLAPPSLLGSVRRA